NVRGLSDPSKHNEVRHFLSSNSISLVGLLESRVSVHNLDKVVRNISNKWVYTSNRNVSLSGRVVVAWNPSNLNFVPALVTEQAIHGHAILTDSVHIHVSFVYGLCDRAARKSLWSELSHCVDMLCNEPWVVLGDFNVTRFGTEHASSRVVTKAIQDFNKVLLYTWSNRRKGAGVIAKKLDRAMGNWQWFKSLGDAYATSTP
ncbi:Exo_endo_phos domain-containing protein, partial [Cephalotus follicularis]